MRDGAELQPEIGAMFDWAEQRGLEPYELMAVASVAIGRVIRASVNDGLPYAGAVALAEQAQRGLLEGAGLPADGSPPPGATH